MIGYEYISHHGYKLQLQGFYLDWGVLFCLGIQTPLVKGLSDVLLMDSDGFKSWLIVMAASTIRRCSSHLRMGDLLFPTPLVRRGGGGGEGV